MNHGVKEKALRGMLAAEAPPAVFEAPPKVTLTGEGSCGRAEIGIPAQVLAKSILFVGESQFGKTNTMKDVMEQVLEQMGPEDACFVLDSKLDFIPQFRRPGDVVLGIDLPGEKGARQNLYREVLADGNDPDAIRDNSAMIADRLFQGLEKSSQPFFPLAAKRTLASFLQLGASIAARLPKESYHYHNRSLRNFFAKGGPGPLRRFMNAAENGGELRSYLGDLTSNQALGVLGELNAALSRFFQGPWSEAGDFSVRQFIRRRGGRTLFLHYSLKDGSSRSELYGLQLDLVIRELLSHPEEKSRGKVYIFLDELKLLGQGAPDMLSNAVNFGISQGLGGVFVGIQSVSQLVELFSEAGANSLLAGFGSVIAFHPNDPATMEFIQGRAGHIDAMLTVPTSAAPYREVRRTEVAKEWDLRRLDVGQALVCLVHKPPFYFHFDKFKKKEA